MRTVKRERENLEGKEERKIGWQERGWAGTHVEGFSGVKRERQQRSGSGE